MRIGDRVRLITERHGVNRENPAWGTPYQCRGKVIRIHNELDDYCYIDVTWDNGKTNCYNHADLLLIPDKDTVSWLYNPKKRKNV